MFYPEPPTSTENVIYLCSSQTNAVTPTHDIQKRVEMDYSKVENSQEKKLAPVDNKFSDTSRDDRRSD